MTPTPQDVEDAKKILAYTGHIGDWLTAAATHIARIRSEAEAKGRVFAYEQVSITMGDGNSVRAWAEDRAAAERAKIKGENK